MIFCPGRSVSNPRRKIALVTHDLASGGGTGTITAFLYRTLLGSTRYAPEIISLATSASDAASTRLRAPRTWGSTPKVFAASWQGLDYRHVGAHAVEFEFQRYRPRAVLDRLLAQYDLIQFIAGTPAWAYAGSAVARPVLLWTATTVWGDRFSRLREATGPRRVWSTAMAGVAQRYERLALRHVEFTFALSRYTLNRLLQWVPRDRAGLGVCGVDTTAFVPGSRQGEHLLSVARFSDPRKNVRLLLTAYATLVRRKPAAPPLVLVGELPSLSILRWVEASGIGDRIRFLGVKSDHELITLYQRALLFVLSSDEEGLGIVLLEAMASGLPVVCTRCGGPETAVVDGVTGLLTPVGDASALAEAMERVLEDERLQREFGQAGRQRAEERFSLAAAGRVFLEKYDEIFASRG